MTPLEVKLFSELYKHHIQKGVGPSEISRASGVELSLVSRLLSGKRKSMSIASAGKLAKYLGLVLGKPVKPSALKDSSHVPAAQKRQRQ